MFGKAVKIVADVVVSFIFFIVAAIVLDLIATKIFGTRSNGHGGTVVDVNGGVMIVATLILTAIFAVWFYRFLTSHKFTKVKN